MNLITRTLMIACMSAMLVVPASLFADKPLPLNLPANYVPAETDYADDGPTRYNGFSMGIGGLRGRPLKPMDGQHAIVLTMTPQGKQHVGVFEVGDIVFAVNGRALPESAIFQFKREVTRGNRLALKVTFSVWRKGESVKPFIQFTGPKPPDLTVGDAHNPEQDPWNLGATGAEGWMWAIPHQTTEGSTQVYITEVKPGTPAEGVLKVGDVVIGAFGEKFTWDARKEFAAALTKAETKEQGGKLKLMVWHDGKTREAVVPMEVMGSYSDTAPFDCEKSDKIVDDAVAHFKKYGIVNIQPDMKRANTSIYTLVNGIGLLATGREDVLPMVKELVDVEKLKFPTDHTWTGSYRLILLCEWYLATGDTTVRDAIKANAVHLARGQSQVGTWGHRIAVPQQLSDGTRYGVAPGYGALNAAGTVALISIILAEECGQSNMDTRQAIKRGSDFLRFYSDKGAVTYGDHTPSSNIHDDNGKSSMAAVVFGLLDDEEYAEYFVKSTIASYNQREDGHTGNYFSFIWGALGAAQGGDAAAAAFMNELEWFHDLERRVHGNFVYQGKPGMADKRNAEHQYIGWDCTGARLLAYCLPRKAIHLTGKGGHKLPAITGDEIADALSAGRLDQEDYDKLPTKELLGKLSSWSPAVRHHASVALGTKTDDNVVSDLLAMLGSDDRFTRYGAVQALREAGRGSAEAADAVLAAMESSDDVTFKFFAVQAFSSYNQEMGLHAHANRAAEAMMKMLTDGKFAEPTGKLEQEVTNSLLYSGTVNPVKAVFRKGDGIEDFNSDLIVMTVRDMLRNKNGITRSLASQMYDNLSDEQLQQLWPDIYRATRELAPSGIMFASGARLDGLKLMAKHNTREGMETAVWYLTNLKFHGASRRLPTVLKLLTDHYQGHAKPLIPQLIKAAEFYEPGGIVEALRRDETGAAIRAAVKQIEAAPTPEWELTSIAEYLD